MEVDGAPQKKEKKPPAAPNTSSDCPCAHNDWDNVRVKKGFITLRCRQCQAQWKTETGNVKKCHNFFQGSCARGAACPSPHIHRYKQSLEKRQAIFGDGLDSTPMPMPTPDSGKRRRRKRAPSLAAGAAPLRRDSSDHEVLPSKPLLDLGSRGSGAADAHASRWLCPQQGAQVLQFHQHVENPLPMALHHFLVSPSNAARV